MTKQAWLNKLRKIFLSTLHYLIGACLILLVAQASATPSLKKTYIAMNIRGNLANAFYPVYINKQNQPFLPLKAIAKKWLDMRVKCDKTFSYCQLILFSHKQIFWINLKESTLGRLQPKYETVPLPKDAIAIIHQHIWLRYDIWQKWLPIKVIWSLEQYKIFINPTYKSQAMLALMRKIELANAKRKQQQQHRIDDMHAILPQKRFNAQARYRLDWRNPLQYNQSTTLQYDTSIDVFKGTLQATGSIFNNTTTTSNSPIFWNYRIRRADLFNRLQIGDNFVNNTLLLPSFNLENSIYFERLRAKEAHQGFVYQGYTLPGTDIDVYRNGVLIHILKANASGIYSISDPNAVAGDVYKFHLYFKDGQQKIITEQMAENDESLLNKGEWDSDIEIGNVRNETLNTLNTIHSASGSYAHSGWRYGLSKHMTLGLDAYRFPSNIQHGAIGINAEWQTFPTLNNLFEAIHYAGNTDYSMLSHFTGFDHQQIQFRIQNIARTSPLTLFNQPVLFDNVPFEDIFPSVNRYWYVKDIIDTNLGNWELTPEYKYSNAGDLYGLNALGNIGTHISLSISSGLARPAFSNNTFFANTSAFYTLGTHSLFQLSRTWFKSQSQTELAYRYQSLKEIGWDVSLGITKPDHGQYSPIVNVQWRMNRSLESSISADKNSITFQLSLLGLFAMQPGPRDYDNYRTGTVAGQLITAPLHQGGKPQPVSHAIISVGGKRAKTNKQGRYVITGLPTNTRLEVRVLANSLDASLIPDKKVKVIELRPGTLVAYNPKLDWDAGMDGTVEHNGQPIPMGTQIEVVKSKKGRVLAKANVERNGFFILNKLKHGHYFLKLKDKKAPLVPFTIEQSQNWISNEKVIWR